MQHKKVNKVVIAGGGTAGWMAAAALSKTLGKTIELTLVESGEIPTVGVGEATIPTLLTLHKLLNIKEQEFVSACQGTFKLGISFENWQDLNENYIHSFGWTGTDHWAAGFQHFWLKAKKMGIAAPFGEYCTELIAAQQSKFAILQKQTLNYAYHIDAGLYAKFLRSIAEQNGAKRVEGNIDEVVTDAQSGFITQLVLSRGEKIDGDLFIDCTGFRGMLIEQTLHTGYEDWTHWLPCDSAVALQTKAVEPPIPFTRAIAREAGWQWRIPLQHRMGNGLVYCSQYQSDDEATASLVSHVEGEPLNDPKVIKSRTGQRRKHWNKNCIAVGLASGFMEPLESTGIHLIQRSIIRLLQMFPYDGIREPDVIEFNAQMRSEADNIRDFIILHYHVTHRSDTRFWQHCRSMSIPDSLQHRIDLFKETGRVFKVPTELFGENSWIQVMLGQGLHPEQYHPIVNMMSDSELDYFMENIKRKIEAVVSQLPEHQQFIDHYCKATDSM